MFDTNRNGIPSCVNFGGWCVPSVMIEHISAMVRLSSVLQNISTNRDLTSKSSFSRIVLQRLIKLETLLMFIEILRCSAIVGRSKLSFSSWFILMLLKVEPELSLANLSCNSEDCSKMQKYSASIISLLIVKIKIDSFTSQVSFLS